MFGRILSGLFGGGRTTTSSSSTTTPTLPTNVQGAQTDLIDRVRAFAATPYQEYTGQRIAEFTPDQLAGFQSARDIAARSGELSQLTPGLVQRGVTATEGLATRLPDTDIEAYMNPYVEGVLDPMLRDIAERSAAERLRLGQQSARTGSFGGSRQAIAESELERGTQRTMAEEAAKQRAAAYTQAVNEFRRDQAAIPGLYAAALGQLGTGQQQNAGRLATEMAPMLQVGGMQQALEQAGLDVARRDFEEQRDFPLRGIEVLRSALSLAPQVLGIGSSGTSTSTAPGPSPLSQLAGVGLQIPSLMSGGSGMLNSLLRIINPSTSSIPQPAVAAPQSNAQVYQSAGVPVGHGPI